jgi:hypothetical protein
LGALEKSKTERFIPLGFLFFSFGLKNKNPDVIGTSLQVEQVTGIGPAYLPWQGNVLPLNYTCMALLALCYYRGVIS